MGNILPLQPLRTQLQKLLGLSAWGPGIIAGMLTVSFGSRRSQQTRRGEVMVGELSLHIQCAWRLVRDEEIVAGFADYMESEDEEEALRSIHAALSAALAEEPTVRDVTSLRGGGFSLALSNGLFLEAFPSLSFHDPDAEFWRLFAPDGLHFVVGPGGVE
jgi:hypothetical protein